MSPTHILKLSSVNPDFLRRVLLLGAMGGAGTGLVQALLKQRKSILDSDDEDSLPAEDIEPTKLASEALNTMMDGTASVANLFNKGVSFMKDQTPTAAPSAGAKPEDRLSMLDYALGGTGGPLAFLLGLAATRGLYNKFEKHELKSEMRDEQEALLAAIEKEGVKTASEDGRQAPGKLDMGLLALLGALGLTGVTTGMLTDQMLTSQFPAARSKPKPVRVLTSMEKDDSGDFQEDSSAFGKSARELLLHTVLSLENGQGDVTDAVKAAAVGLLPDVTDALVTRGTDAAFETCAAAQHHELSPLAKFAAVRAVNNSAMGPVVALVAASVFADKCPWHRTKGASIRKHPDLELQFQKLAALTIPVMLWASDPEACDHAMSKEASAAEQEAAEDILEGRPIDGALVTGEADSLMNMRAQTSHGAQDNVKIDPNAKQKGDPVDTLLKGVS